MRGRGCEKDSATNYFGFSSLSHLKPVAGIVSISNKLSNKERKWRQG